MWRLEYLWLLATAPLAWLAYRYLPPYVQARSALRTPFFDAMARLTGKSPSRPGVQAGRGQLWLNVAVWLLVLLALARPQWVEPPLTHTEPVRDILLAVDISQSMDSADFRDAQGRPATRWQAVKAVVADFIAKRKNDRLGLIVFGTGAYPQASLTRDHATLQLLLDQTAVGMAGPNTAIGDAIGLGIRMLDAADERDKVMILLTDGNDTGSAVPPPRAAELAAAHHITVHTIGIGDPRASGEDRVDFGALQAIARATGGSFPGRRPGRAAGGVRRTRPSHAAGGQDAAPPAHARILLGAAAGGHRPAGAMARGGRFARLARRPRGRGPGRRREDAWT